MCLCAAVVVSIPLHTISFCTILYVSGCVRVCSCVCLAILEALLHFCNLVCRHEEGE